LFDIEKWLPFLLAKGHQAAHTLMKNSLDEFGLTPPQFATLAFLWKTDGINQHELGCLMKVDRTTISGILERLERLEFVSRGMDPRDRRSYVLFVTKKGKKLYDRLVPALNNVNEEISLRLTGPEQEQLALLLKKLR